MRKANRRSEELEKAILLQLGSERKMISEVEESGIAARQTVHTRVEQLVGEGYLQEEREQKLPFRRHLSLTEKGRQVLERVQVLDWADRHLDEVKKLMARKGSE